jgi:hypothetical protein
VKSNVLAVHMHMRIKTNRVLKDFLKKGVSKLTEINTVVLSWMNRNRKLSDKESAFSFYFTNGWLLLNYILT